MTDRISGYADAVVALARAEDALDIVETELAAIAHAVEANGEMRDRLADLQIPVAQRLKLLEADALGAAHPATRAALSMVIASNRSMDLPRIAQQVSETAAAGRDRDLAEVQVATPLNEEQTEQLRRALERATGKSLDVQVVVDPTVLGGVRARIGDTVIDGSVARRLQDVRTHIGA